MISPEPKALVLISQSMAQIAERLVCGFPLAKTAAGHQFVDQVRRADGQLRQKLRAIEQKQQQFKNRRIAVPQFKQRCPRAVSADEIVQASNHTVRIRQRHLSVGLRRPVSKPESGGPERTSKGGSGRTPGLIRVLRVSG